MSRPPSPTSSKTPSPTSSKTASKESQMLPSSSQQMRLRIENSIEGQLAILIEDDDADIIAVPLNLYNKYGKVILSVERTRRKSVIWGIKFGHWSVPNAVAMAGAEYPHGFGVMISTNKLFVSRRLYSNKKTLIGTTNVVFLVRNQLGDLVFAAKTRTNMKARYPFGRAEQIDVKLLDPFKREIVFCRQLLRFSSGVSPCCLQCMEVMAQPSKPLGIVRQKWTFIGLEFVVEDNKQNKIFRVKSSQSGMRFKYEEYKILSMDNKEVGRIRPSLNDDKLTPAKEFPILSVEFDENMNPIQKTLLMSAVFLIKNLYYD